MNRPDPESATGSNDPERGNRCLSSPGGLGVLAIRPAEEVVMRGLVSWRLACLVALLLCGGTAPGQEAAPGPGKQVPLTPEQTQRLKERERALQEVNRLGLAGKSAEAATLWAKEIALDRKAFGQVHGRWTNRWRSSPRYTKRRRTSGRRGRRGRRCWRSAPSCT